MVQNTAARILRRIRKYDHITETLGQLHWLQVEFRIKYKICFLTFKALRGQGPQYISDMLSVCDGQYCLRSHTDLKLVVPSTKHTTIGDRSFHAAAPKLWNALHFDLHNAGYTNTFKTKLKTHFFYLAFK